MPASLISGSPAVATQEDFFVFSAKAVEEKLTTGRAII
jgi:hypothetical protein